jgi:hypothetical protein
VAQNSRALEAARQAVNAAEWLPTGKGDRVAAATGLVIERAVQAQQQAGVSERVCPFITTLDDRILVAEVSAFTDDAVSQVLWRAANDKGFAAAWLVRFADGTYGLRRKLGARFAWARGSRDDVLAHVPDGMFEIAVRNALSRDR